MRCSTCGLCVEEHGALIVSSDSGDGLEIDDSGITLLLDEHGVVSSDSSRYQDRCFSTSTARGTTLLSVQLRWLHLNRVNYIGIEWVYSCF